MMTELRDLLVETKEDHSIKVIVIKGAGKAFSAGVDIKAAGPEDFLKGGSFMDLGQELAELFMDMPQVMIAQVHGYCFTGALELVLFFDLVYCTKNTQFADTHAKWAIMPRWGMSQRLSRKIGLEKAKELTFRALRIDGQEAHRIGLVNDVFDEEELEDKVNKIVEDILSNSFEAIVAIKKLYNTGFQTTLQEGLQIEYDADTRLSDTSENLKNFNAR